MAIGTYAELQTAAQNWLRRVGDTDYAERVPELIDLAEAQFNRDFSHRRMETSTDLVTVANTKTVALPTDYIETRLVELQTSPLIALSYVTPSQLSSNWPDGSTGKPEEYTIIGQNLKLGKTPDAVYTLELTYYQRIPELTDSATTNWLLTYHPDLYLYGTLLQAAPYLKAHEDIPVWGAFYDRGKEGLDKDAKRSAWNGGPLYTRVSTFTA